MQNRPASDRLARISPARMIVLGMGWFGTHFFWGFYTGSMPLFLKDFTDSKFMISLVLSLAGVTSCILPPIVGYISDRTPGRFGRRRPYLLLGMFGVLLCLVGLPSLTSFGMVIAVSAIMYFSIAIAETPLASLLPDTTPPEQRSTVSGAVHLLGSLGLIAFFLASSRIWDADPDAVFYMVAGVSFGSALITVTLVSEPGMPLEQEHKRITALGYLKSVAEETNALKYFCAEFFWWLGFYIVSSFITLFVVEELNVPEGKSLLVPMGLTIVATIFVLPLGILGDRVGRKQILSCMIAFWAVAGIFIGLSQNLTHAIIAVGVTGIPFAAVMGVGYAFMLDLIPPRRTAEFIGINIISISIAMVFGPVIGGKLIDVFGYRFIYPVAALFMFIGLVLLQFVRPRQKEESSAGA